MAGSPYSDQEQRDALALFVLASAKPRPYAKLLESHPEIAVPYGTVKRWAYTDKRDLHQQVKSELSGTVYGAMEDNALGLAESAVGLWSKAASELAERLDDEEMIKAMKDADLIKVMHESAVSFDISLGKAMAIGGRPTQITRLDLGDIRKQLETRHGIKIVLPGEEVIDAEAVEDEEPSRELPAEIPA